MASDDDYEIPESGAIFTFGRSGFADNQPSHFFIRNDPIVEVSCGDEHTVVVCKNGRVFVFGYNSYGQLGLGHTKTVNKPSCLKYLKPFHSTHAACGKGHTIISTECGRLFSFGSNSDGQLGVGNMSDVLIPQLINTDQFNDQRIIAVSAGCLHSACLLGNGDLYLWGNNSDGQCGIDVDSYLLTPTKIIFEDSIIAVSCGYYHTAFISQGCLFTFGEEDNGKLGYRQTTISNLPQKVELGFKAAKVSCGGNHTLVLSDEGRVFAFGSNFSGQLGINSTDAECYASVPVNFPEDVKIIYVSAGESHSAFITESGELYTCGDSRYGKICGDHDSNCFSPVLVSLFVHFFCVFISCGGCHTMVMAREKSCNCNSETLCSKNKISSLPPLKIKKMLTEREIILHDDMHNTDYITKNDIEEISENKKSTEDQNNSWDETNGLIEDENIVCNIDDEYVDIQEIQVKENEDKDIQMETENSIPGPGPDRNTDIESDVIIRSESRIKKFVDIFRRRKSAARTGKDSEYLNRKINDAHEKHEDGQRGNQSRSRTCNII